MNSQDPGWKPALKGVWRGLLPYTAHMALQRSVLLGARGLVLASLFQWTAYGVILSFLGIGNWRPTMAIVLVAAFGVVTLLLVVYFRRRPFASGDADALRQSAAQTFLVTYSLANAPVLAGFVGFFVVSDGKMLTYLSGIPFGLLAFALGGPTKANLARRQDEIRKRGTPLSLVEILSSGHPK
jgi:hypothetical protein